MSLKKLGARIKASRLKSKTSIRALADRVNISKSHLFLVEQGERSPSDELLVSLCAQLGLDFDAVAQLRGKLPVDVERFLVRQPKLLRRIRKEMVTS
jgi:transcriptional regulator with XRE-family HTH domain